MLEKPPKSICILRLSAIGDVCHMVAVVQSIQRYFPNVPITWIIGKVEASLVSDLPGVEFIIFDKAKGWRAYLDLYHQLKARHFDVLLHAQVAIRASLASLCVRAKVRIGFDKVRAKDGQWLFTRQSIKAVDKQHVIEGFQEFAACVGVPIAPLHWSVPIPPACLDFIKQQVNSEKPILVIHPAASKSERNWSVAGYVGIAEYAIEKGMSVVLSGGPSEHEQTLAAAIQAGCSQVINLVGKTNLKQSLALLKLSTALIAPDTGPAHMATMVGTPVIGLYACSNPNRTGPYLSLATTVNEYPNALQHYLQLTEDDAPWGKRVHGDDVMNLITLEKVREKLDIILSSPQ